MTIWPIGIRKGSCCKMLLNNVSLLSPLLHDWNSMMIIVPTINVSHHFYTFSQTFPHICMYLLLKNSIILVSWLLALTFERLSMCSDLRCTSNLALPWGSKGNNILPWHIWLSQPLCRGHQQNRTHYCALRGTPTEFCWYDDTRLQYFTCCCLSVRNLLTTDISVGLTSSFSSFSTAMSGSIRSKALLKSRSSNCLDIVSLLSRLLIMSVVSRTSVCVLVGEGRQVSKQMVHNSFLCNLT